MKLLIKLSFLSLPFLFFACGQQPAAEAEVDTASTEVADVRAEPTGLAIGDVAPDFELTGTDGKTHSLATTTAADGSVPRGYIVTFTCNTCPFAKGYEGRLAALHEKMSAMGYPVVAIQPNDVSIKPGDNMGAMQLNAKEKGFGFAYLLDAEQSVYPRYGASKTPEIYLLDADRVLRYHGAIDDSAQDPDAVTINYVENAVAALEKGETPNPQEVKAIGCGIKAK